MVCSKCGMCQATELHTLCSRPWPCQRPEWGVLRRQFHLNKMVKVSGVVTRRTGVFPQLQMVKFDCLKCGHLLGPYYQNTETEIKANTCPQCQGKNCFQVLPGCWQQKQCMRLCFAA